MGAKGARIRNSWGGGKASLPHQYLIIITRMTSGIIFFSDVLGIEKIVGERSSSSASTQLAAVHLGDDGQLFYLRVALDECYAEGCLERICEDAPTP
jgi:hypothetical protein